mmetsp:Transcript_61552/g.199238  ORF Transcript_61552/g.199238 Transcript_61552/m.199238 type:complete len:248 (+) Transcript_61552:92-835(+)
MVAAPGPLSTGSLLRTLGMRAYARLPLSVSRRGLRTVGSSATDVHSKFWEAPWAWRGTPDQLQLGGKVQRPRARRAGLGRRARVPGPGPRRRAPRAACARPRWPGGPLRGVLDFGVLPVGGALGSCRASAALRREEQRGGGRRSAGARERDRGACGQPGADGGQGPGARLRAGPLERLGAVAAAPPCPCRRRPCLWRVSEGTCNGTVAPELQKLDGHAGAVQTGAGPAAAPLCARGEPRPCGGLSRR